MSTSKTMSEEVVLYQVSEQVATITLNRPERRNSLNEDIIRGVSEGLAKADDDAEVRVIVLTGAGESFLCWC